LSFLQSAALVVQSALGQCDFTAKASSSPTQIEGEQHRCVSRHDGRFLEIDSDRAEHLANEYLTATGCLLDLFDADTLVLDIRRWAFDQSSPTSAHKSVILLVAAIGSQMDHTISIPGEASALFERGRQLAYDIMAEEPSVAIVQAFSLITMYLMGDGRSNIAFMNLGIALRAAYTLGLHRRDFASFSAHEHSVREKAWQSVRVLDVFLSASTGRPPATSDSEKDQTYVPGTPQMHCTDNPDKRFSRATFGLCAIGERILIDVYKKRSVSTVLVQKISHQIRDWVSTIPTMPAALDLQTKSVAHLTLARIIASAHLMGAYYWAIILLTRPFLLFHVSMRQSQAQYASNGTPSGAISTIAEACIVAAMNGMDLVQDVLRHADLPKRLPVILNSVLNCAITVGVAAFADYDREFPLTSSFERCLAALKQMGLTDPLALHYLDIVESLSDAVDQYISMREENALHGKCKQFDAFFGSVNSHFALPHQQDDGNEHTGFAYSTISPTSTMDFDFNFGCLTNDAYATIFPSGLLLSQPGLSPGFGNETAADYSMMDGFDGCYEMQQFNVLN
jgi:hypothetical protein